ncbi:MAG: hypothetical protein NVS4B3_21410 [Gemmatimonadaceae bacterium]
MIDADDRVVLTDFGISKALDGASSSSPLTRTGVVVGTPHYMAPEQALGAAVDGRADQYALAVVAYQMLTGQLLFDGDSDHAVVYRHVHEAVPRLSALCPDVPPAIEATLAKALSKAPSNRFAAMADFANALTGSPSPMPDAAQGATPPAARTGVLSPTVRQPAVTLASGASRGPRWMAALSILLIGSLVAGGVVAATRASDRETAAEGKHLLVASPSATRADLRSPARPVAAKHPHAAAKGDLQPRTATRVAQTRLSVASTPRASLFVDGVNVGMTPVVDRPISIGRSHEVRLERAGYKTRRETILSHDARAIHRRYVLKHFQAR